MSNPTSYFVTIYNKANEVIHLDIVYGKVENGGLHIANINDVDKRLVEVLNSGMVGKIDYEVAAEVLPIEDAKLIPSSSSSQ